MACLAILLLTSACTQKKAVSQAPVVVQEGVRFCESTYPYDGGLLIANFGTEQLNPLNTEGKGYILHYRMVRPRPSSPPTATSRPPRACM